MREVRLTVIAFPSLERDREVKEIAVPIYSLLWTSGFSSVDVLAACER
jgi:hypothetical protein